jgi:hypothetical protein
MAGHSDALYCDANAFCGANIRVILLIGLDQAVLVDSIVVDTANLKMSCYRCRLALLAFLRIEV